MVVVRIGAKLVRVTLRSRLELWRGRPLLARHGRVQVCIAGLLARTTASGARSRGPGGRGTSGSVASGASSTSEVLVGELMCQASVGVVTGARRIGATLVVVGALGEVGVVGLHGRSWVAGGRILLVLGEIVVGLSVAVLLLLALLGLLHATGTRLALLGRINGLGKGGWSGRIGAVGIDTEAIAVVVIVANV